MHICAIRGSFRRRVWHPCHTHAALRIPSTEPIPSLFAQVLPRNSRNSQKLQAEDILPRISQIFTEASGGEEPPTDFTDVHRFLGCVLPPNLCTSVQSVGEYLAPEVFCILWENCNVGARLLCWYSRDCCPPLVGCKKCIDFFVVTKFRCIFAM